MGERSTSYRCYSFETKSEVRRLGHTNLFPQLNIPRTTAAYWISKRSEVISSDHLNSIYQDKIKFLEDELAKEKALRTLIEQVGVIFPFDFSTTRIKNRETKKKLVSAVEAATKYHQLKVCLECIGISPRIYYRWIAANKTCALTQGPCTKKHPNQLTDREIQKMKTYLTSKKYSHIPIHSLCFLAQRNSDLFCSVDTWYKYKKMFEWSRPNIRWERSRKEVGRRATQPNEIWHIDITYIALGNGMKVYLQTVVDNYSRFLISWKLTRKISALNTVANLKLARASALKKFKELSGDVMMDGGPENKNGRVLRFIESSNMKRVIARSDIEFSNSMVEAFFRSLKNNFLYYQKFQTMKDLEKKLKFYFKQHNEVIPHSAHSGATPKEVFSGIWGEDLKTKLETEKQAAYHARRQGIVKGCDIC